MRRLALSVVIAAQLASTAAVADEWSAPRVQQIFSPNGQYFVRIVPGTGANGMKGPDSVPGRSRGEFYARQRDRSYRLVADVELRNPVSPTYAVVTDAGYLVTFDDWGSLGFGNPLVFYSPAGVVISAVTMEELYASERLKEIPRSVSSRWWRCQVFYTAPQGREDESLTVFEHFGGTFQLRASAGTFDYRPGSASCATGTARIF